jgi:hypothetical protein
LQVLKNLRNYYFEGKNLSLIAEWDLKRVVDRYFQDVEDDVKKLVPGTYAENYESELQFRGLREWGTAVLKTSQLYRKRDVLFVLQQVVSTKVTRIM